MQSAPALFSSPGEQMGRSLCTVIPGGTPAGEFEIRAVDREGSPFAFHEAPEGRLVLLEEGQPVLAYNFGIQSPEGVPQDRWRSTYIHPLYDLAGRVLTDDFPADHLHHRGLSWMWQRVSLMEPAGAADGVPKEYDLWHIRGIRQRFEAWLGRESGPVCASIGMQNSWRLEDRKVADEWVWIRVFRAGPLGRAIDLSLTWKALEDIVLKGEEVKGYGGLCLRLASREEGSIVSSGGAQRADSDLESFAWADYSGRFDGALERSGVAVFQHPGNPGAPAGWCLRHYGFLGVSFPGSAAVFLSAGQTLRLKFRVWIHAGGAREGNAAEAYEVYADPPVLEWIR